MQHSIRTYSSEIFSLKWSFSFSDESDEFECHTVRVTVVLVEAIHETNQL